MELELDGRVAVVVGAGSSGPGISNGKAAALAYARAGATVIAIDQDAERAEETRELVFAEGGDCTAVMADATDPGGVAEAIDGVLAEHGSIDILHNNVGIPNVAGRTELDHAHWNDILDTNLTSAFLSCERVLPVMVRQRRGVITNISSGAGLKVIASQVTAWDPESSEGLFSLTAYGASKAGLNQFTRTLAVIYAPYGIRCNVVVPGNIDTPRIRGYQHIVEHYGGEDAMLAARHAMSLTGRMGTPWDVANAAVFLATDRAAYINGVILPVDGGLSAT
jgi:NAD(P)-dependent dehydrogenase (short-subunit alcohol dehydrogenase family)